MTKDQPLQGRTAVGILALEPRVSSGAIGGAFEEEFGSKAPYASEGPLVVAASHAVIGDTASIWAQGACVFWDSRRDAYTKIDSRAALDAIAPAVRSGAAWPALDDCVVFQDRSGVLLFASGSGATTFYYTQRKGYLAFANRPQAIRSVRDAPIDRLGVGEIVRFGANYGRRTLLRGLNRIPIGHVLKCDSGKPPRQRAFINFSHCPTDVGAEEMRRAIAAGLDQNLRLIEGPRDLLFSGGVDSALLALRGLAGGTVGTGWFYSMGPGDPEHAVARRAAATMGLKLETVEDSTRAEDIVQRIAAYALPTLDFSVIPTHALGSAVAAARTHTTFIDGTGGDAWFGFGSLTHADSWLALHHFRALSPVARRLYAAALPWENRNALRPLKGLARTPSIRSAALGHMCANPVYSTLLDLSADEWLAIEEELHSLMCSLTGSDLGSAAGETIVSDACLIAVAQFAAKTSQWNIAARAPTYYPFLMPNMVALGRTMPHHLLIRDSQAKPLLKDLVAASPLGEDFAFRRKSGFQPPLQKLLQDESGREILFANRTTDEAPWTHEARDLPHRLLRARNSLRIGGLYAIWAQIVVEFWLKSLRHGR